MSQMPAATWKYKGLMFVIYMVAYAVLYILPNLHPSFHPYYLPMLDFEHRIPFLDWSFVVYLSDYLLILSAIALVRDLDRFNALCRVSFMTLAICGTFFLVFPTTYPRPDYPPPPNPFVGFFMGLVGNLDTPNNCFPSMHVAITGGTAWCLRYLGRRWFGFYSLWSMAIFLSTLTTKQHYFVDIFGGLLVVVAVALIEWAFFEKDLFGVYSLAKKRLLLKSYLKRD